jgi:hypothetical protein
MDPDTDLKWLAEHRPDPDPPSPVSTDRARASLIAHRVRRRHVRQRAGALTAVAVVGAVAVAFVVTGNSAVKRSQPTVAAQRLSPPAVVTPQPTKVHVRRTPLTTLVSDVRMLRPRPQPGNATLVVRYTVIDGRHEIDGAVYGGYDLYTDAGKYYYAASSLAQLQRSYDRHQVSIDGGDEAKALRTIAAAANGTPAQARAAVVRSLPPSARRAQIRHQLSTLPEPERHRFLHQLLGPHTKAQLRAAQDSHIYGAATQALEVGAGRPDVRAASISALSTLRHVTERHVRLDGVDALRVDFPDGGTSEIIWLDARTGVPIQEKDAASSATVFEVERVDAAHLPRRVSPVERLR